VEQEAILSTMTGDTILVGDTRQLDSPSFSKSLSLRYGSDNSYNKSRREEGRHPYPVHLGMAVFTPDKAMIYDSIVIGCGPAGSTALRTMAKAGLQVLGLEKQAIGRYKPCAGAISGACQDLLDLDLGHLICHEITSVELRYDHKRFIREWKQPVASLVMRDEFDAFLANQAKIAGATILEDTPATSLEQHHDSVIVHTNKGAFTAKSVIAADGCQGISRRLLKLPKSTWGISIHSEIPMIEEYRHLAHRPIVWFAKPQGGYAWCFPKRDYLSCGAGTTNPKYRSQVRKSFDDFLTMLGIQTGQSKLWAHQLADGTERVPLVHGRLLLTGDAGSLADPLSGEGILHAIYSGQQAGLAAVRAVENNDFTFPHYQKQIDQSAKKILNSAGTLAKLIHWKPRLTFGLCTRFPFLFDYYFSIIAGERTHPGCQLLSS
jgi:geranylgeranyl reductase family protein